LRQRLAYSESINLRESVAVRVVDFKEKILLHNLDIAGFLIVAEIS
jgi:hypothetical protein